MGHFKSSSHYDKTSKCRNIPSCRFENRTFAFRKKIEIPIEDAALVAGQTGVDIETAKKVLIETEGDLAAAILKLRH